MTTEKLSSDNINHLIPLVLKLWPDCVAEEEHVYFSGMIAAEQDVCYLVKFDHVYIAFIHVSVRNDYVEGAEDLPVAYIEGIYVTPDYQRKGVAKHLVKVAEDWALEKGIKQIASDTSVSNDQAIAFHKGLGFSEVERIVCFIRTL
ncbi:aminoglycoside 6'-N-acetyltransferase I [Chitinophaga sp. YR627]|uniref:aminoglycoside 6'-N-acetyltransferase n=1 Tax=Chitinophaga sp. YR627 TaxID=1881041 RepID=UPI0008F2EDC3|nr:aminoglycoside 6'-N-acetyltransferase [Chitinophaga sp. YR627]SFO88066.1 aminoglycoside 6'-N-acetyltransferase I [Chitinophaga sp. YR627]